MTANLTTVETICVIVAALWLAGLFLFLNWARKEERRKYQAEIEYWRRFAMENGLSVDIQPPQSLSAWPPPLPQDCAVKRDSHSNPEKHGGGGG